MKKQQTEQDMVSEFKTIGDVKTRVDVWSRLNTYKTKQRVKGRTLKMPEAAAEMIERGLTAEGIK
jgi:hypothetical protein